MAETLGIKLDEETRQRLKALGELRDRSPQIGRPLADGTGRRELSLSFGSGPYILRYILEGEHAAVVLRVWHSRENRTD